MFKEYPKGRGIQRTVPQLPDNGYDERAVCKHCCLCQRKHEDVHEAMGKIASSLLVFSVCWSLWWFCRHANESA